MTATLFGRSAELAELHLLARAAAAGAGGFVFVEGDAGIGKSALLDTFAAKAAVEFGAVVLRGRAWEEGGAPPFWPWQEIAIAGSWAVEWATHDDQFTLYRQVLNAARHATLGNPGPLVLIVDDLHATDADTIRLTRFMARSIVDAPIALVAAARPSDQLSAVGRLGSRLALTALGDDFADEVITASSATPLDPATRARIRVAADGNPLFLRELARSAITGRRIPADILSVVTPVLERQTDETRSLVEHAAVLGRSFRLDRLVAVSGRTLDEVLHALEPLRHDGVISLSGEPLLGMFSHQLIRDVLYQRVEPARRLELHAAVAEVLSREPGSGSLGERAHHLLAAVPVVDAAVAASAARSAATQARANLAFSEAASLLRRAAELTVDDHERVALLVDVGTNWRDGGQVAVASTAFDEAIDLARRIDDVVAFASAVLARTQLVRWESSATEFTAVIGDALARLRTANTAQQGEVADLTVRLLARRATLLAVGTDLEAPLSAAKDALRLARDLGPGHDRPLADSLAAMHRCCWAPGLLAESLAIGQELVAVTDRLDDLDGQSEALLAELIDQLRAGDIKAVDGALDQYATLVARSRRPRHEFFLLSRRAMRAFLAGRLADGERLIERAFELGQRIEEPDAFQVFHGARMVLVDQLQEQDETLAAARLVDGMARAGESRLFVYAAHSYLRAGHKNAAHEAMDLLHQALPSLTLATLPLFDLCLVAEVAAACNAVDIAGELWSALLPHAGLTVVNAGAVTFGGVVDEYLAGLARTLGNNSQAHQYLTSAAAHYQTLGAKLFYERVTRHLGELATVTPNGAPTAAAMAPVVTAVLRRRDDSWEVGLGGTTSVLRDARGLQHLHALLGAPNRELLATDLIGVQASDLAAREAHHALLDDRAKAAYRQRIRDLQADLDEADAYADIERATRLRAELDLLLDELRKAVGLGGRDRLAATTAERARVTVRKAITASTQRIAEHDPRLAHLLRTTVTTGYHCSYKPDPINPLTWQLT